MPDTIRHRVQQIIDSFWREHGQQSFATTRDHVFREYLRNYPAASDDMWDRYLRNEVMRAVQGILEDMT